MSLIDINPKLDLILERIVPVPRAKVWKAWTTPEHLMPWFCPKPWTVTDCRIDLRPGGAFYSVMRSPEGQEFPSEGCYLEVVEGHKFTWTDAMSAGYRPNGTGFMTATLWLEDHPEGTKYTAIALHKDPEDREKHEKMGFYDGWGTVVDQLVAYIQSGAL